MEKYKNKIILSLIIIIILLATFFWGGNAPGLKSTKQTEEIKTSEQVSQPTIEPTTKPEPLYETPVATQAIQETPTPTPTQTKAEPETTKAPVALDENVKTSCTISIKCDTILNNLDWLDETKKEIIPADGIILKETIATFDEGENVFDVLERVTKENKIHLEFVHAPIYNSAYIEGIANIYEFDCGELSGWVYKVNGTAPKYGSSKYILKNGDQIEWVYTCNLGKDVGGYNFS